MKQKQKTEYSVSEMSRWGVGPVFAGLSILFSLIPLSISFYFFPFFQIKFIPQIILTISGIIFILTGLTIFLISYFTVDSAYYQGKFVRTGVYRCCRHPLYASWVIFTVPGMVLIVNSWLGLTAPVFMYFLLRKLVQKEETYMEQKFGNVYTEYRRRTPGILPFGIFKKDG
ncbi:MAG: isoprenylcysteine carboxylmethyltransferase family protein [Calditrichaeota bacterium]|nr:isoprenylcysteine carboxylmethyltransferase family protein [Calditrichota bacterium]